MRVPVRVPIAGVIVKIDYEDQLIDLKDNMELRGETHCGDRQIKISKTKNTSEQELFATIFHEILHAALDETGYSEILGEDREEAMVRGLETAIAGLFVLDESNKQIKWREVEFPWEK